MTLTNIPVAASPVKDITTQEFVPEVVKASLEQPVLVDFWAPWCGPCKQLGPVLEKAVAATGGKVKLVKMDIDQNPQLAQQMGIQSIPAVYAFYKGQPVDGFLGVQPESTIRQFLDKLIRISGGGAVGAALAEILADAEKFLTEGNIEEANALYASVLEQDPVNAAAYAGLMKIALALGQPEEAQAMLDEAPDEIRNAKELGGVKAQLELSRKAVDAGPVGELMEAVLAHPDDHQKRYDLAMALHAKGRSAEAIDQLLESIRRDRKWNDEAARKQLVTIFEALGFMHELSVDGRRKLSAILFK